MILNVFRPHHSGKKLENATIIGHFGSVSEENSGREIIRLLRCPPLKSSVFKPFFVYTKRQAGVFKSPPVWRAVFFEGLEGKEGLTVEI